MSSTVDQQLLKTAADGDLAGVEKALGTGARVDAKDEYHNTDNTALNWAALWGHAEVVRRLLEAGADIENKGSADLTPLGLATTRGHFAAAQILLDRGARVSDDVLSTIQTKVNILEENAEAGMVTEERVKAWQEVLDFLGTQRLRQDLPEIATDLLAADVGRRSNAALRAAEAAKRGIDVAAAAPALAERIADADAEIRNRASAALAHHLARAGEWKKLRELLESSDAPIRSGAAEALAYAARDHADAAAPELADGETTHPL